MRLVAQFILGFCTCCFALSQHNMMPTGLTGKIVLLGINEVKKEVQLTPDEDKQVQNLFKNAQKDPSSFGIPDMHYFTRSLDKKLAEILEPTQLQRLNELFMQTNGLLTLSESEVCSAIGVTEAIKAEAQKLIKEHDQQAMATLMEVQKTHKIDQRKLDESDKKVKEALEALLTDDQKSKWKVMQGKPFKFPKMGR